MLLQHIICIFFSSFAEVLNFLMKFSLNQQAFSNTIAANNRQSAACTLRVLIIRQCWFSRCCTRSKRIQKIEYGELNNFQACCTSDIIVKYPRYRPAWPRGAPRFLDTRHPCAPAAFTPRNILVLIFQRLSRPGAHELVGCFGKKSPVTRSGIDPGTFRLAALCVLTTTLPQAHI